MSFFKNKYLRCIYIFVFFILYMMICFLVPFTINGSSDILEKKIDIRKSVNDTEKSIKLLLSEDNSIVEMSFNDYLKGVLVGEVPVNYEIEALKAQAVVARTYTLHKLKNGAVKHSGGADMCDDINCCQAYKTKEYAFQCWDDSEEKEKWAKFDSAVESTSGEVILYSGELINAFFHAHSGGKTESVKFLWSKQEIPYLISVPGNEGYTYQDVKVFSNDEFKSIVREKIGDMSGEIDIVIQDYTGSGRVNNLSINNVKIEATTLRSLLGLRSTNFRVEKSDDKISFYTVGYGHGIGMSQEGANQMAIDGKNHIEIIKHYYTGVEISSVDV